MARFDLLEGLKIVTPRMIAAGLVHPFREAYRTLRAAEPGAPAIAHGLRAVIQGLQKAPPVSLPPTEAFERPTCVTHTIRPATHTLDIHTDRGIWRITLLDDDVMLLRYRTDGVFDPPASYGVDKHLGEWPRPALSIEEDERQIRAAGGAMILTIEKQPYHLRVEDNAGRVIIKEYSGPGTAGQQRMWQLELQSGTACYGLGEKADRTNHTGKRFELWNTDQGGYSRDDDPLYMSIPFMMLHSRGVTTGLFFDNPYRAWVDCGDTRHEVLEYRVVGGELRVYAFSGTPLHIMEQYTALTGRAKLPPLWALGFHQSRWSYFPQERILELAREFRQRRLPCDVIHLDIHYMDGYRCFTWNPERFPEPRAMLKTLHETGFKGLSMIDPGIKVDRNYRVCAEGLQHGYFISYRDSALFSGPVWPGACYFTDFTDPAARAWWGEQYRGLIEDGMDAFWNDMNEIALIIPHRQDSPVHVPDTIQHKGEDGNPRSHAEIHNVYGLLMTQASVEGLARLRPDRRPLLLSRSGWAGLQRYSMHWTGDNHSTWDDLLLSIQMILGLGMSGIALTGSDVGGFTGGPSPELFARWMQLGAFSPFYRAHSMIGSPDQEPWAFGPEVEAINRKYLELRYQLLPYIYTATWQAAQSGAPLARALVLCFPDDPAVVDRDDEYLFGDALLVAPVVTEGATEREVYLPAGEWYDFWSEERFDGPGMITVQAPLDRLPLFVKGGAVIPMWPVQQYVGEDTAPVLTLAAYPANGEHQSVLYEDDGASPDYLNESAHCVSRFSLSQGRAGMPVTLRRTIVEGTYRPANLLCCITLHGMPGAREAVLEGGEIRAIRYEAESRTLTIEIDSAGDFALIVTP